MIYFEYYKGKKKLGPRILDLARLSLRIKGEREFPKNQVKGVHHHQTSLIRNIKETCLGGKEKAVTRSVRKLWKKKSD